MCSCSFNFSCCTERPSILVRMSRRVGVRENGYQLDCQTRIFKGPPLTVWLYTRPRAWLTSRLTPALKSLIAHCLCPQSAVCIHTGPIEMLLKVGNKVVSRYDTCYYLSASYSTMLFQLLASRAVYIQLTAAIQSALHKFTISKCHKVYLRTKLLFVVAEVTLRTGVRSL